MGQGGRQGTNLGTAYASVMIDHSGVEAGMNAARNAIKNGLSGIGDSISNIGGQISQLGGALTQTFTPMAGVLGLATKSAMDFDEAMTNVGAVLGKNADEMAAMREQVLGIGTESRFGANETAMAFYDIVGGVADATTHMAILEASISTAQAGNAELTGTTSALISVMNAYGFSADKAGFSSDVLTQIVGKGVGTMDEFASALPKVAGTAAAVGIEFDQLGANIAFMTTKGFSASEATTRLNSAISSLLTPNEAMKDAFEAAGIESGSLALEQDGLAKTLAKVEKALGGNKDALAKALGSQEALQAALALTGESYQDFENTFISTTDGVTKAAEDIQMDSAAADFDLMKSEVEALGIEIGSALIPVLRDLVKEIKPIIKQVINWVKENPDLVKQIGLIVGGLGVLGPILGVVGAAISGIGAIIGVILSPIGLLIGGVVALGAAFQTNFMGIRDAVQPILDEISTYIQTVVLPTLEQLYNWFVNEALPAIIGFITTTVIPGIQAFVQLLANIWNTVAPALAAIFDWFVTTALPAIVNFVQTVVIPAVQSLIEFIIRLWNDVQPFLASLFDWFVTTALPAIVNFIETVVIPAVEFLIETIASIWETVGPVLQSVFDWFMTNGLPFIIDFINNVVTPVIQGLIDILAGIWTVVEPVLTLFREGFETVFTLVIGFIDQTILPAIQSIINILSGIWNSVQQPLNDFKAGVESVFNWIKVNVIDPIIARIQEFIGTLQSIKEGVEGLDLNPFDSNGIMLNPFEKGGLFNRDSGGMGVAGQPYLIGQGAQPELFIPQTDGFFIPNADHEFGRNAPGGAAGNTTTIQTLIIQANSAAEGRAAADGFNERMQELMRSGG